MFRNELIVAAEIDDDGNGTSNQSIRTTCGIQIRVVAAGIDNEERFVRVHVVARSTYDDFAEGRVSLDLEFLMHSGIVLRLLQDLDRLVHGTGQLFKCAEQTHPIKLVAGPEDQIAQFVVLEFEVITTTQQVAKLAGLDPQIFPGLHLRLVFIQFKGIDSKSGEWCRLISRQRLQQFLFHQPGGVRDDLDSMHHGKRQLLHEFRVDRHWRINHSHNRRRNFDLLP